MLTADTYRRVKVAGLLMAIPVILVTGPIGGFIIAEMLIAKLGFPGLTTVVLILFGLAGSLFETARVIRFVIKIGV